jgi:hypothetical protein
LAFFFDSCVAWREGENSDTVVLVEFKKPMRDNYTVGRDPVQQVFHYVKLVPVGNSILLATDIELGDAPALCERSVA